ncbi:MAG: restriction endonuclease subunit S [Clostridia bacterium]|nr:restriction endonuclease subunit S [Clostridia bacterium]
MGEWKETRFSEIATVIMGQSPASEFYNSDGKGFPFMQGNRTFGDRYPTIDTYTTQITKKAPQNSILMSVRAPVGDINIAPLEMCIGRGLCAINAKDGNNEFVRFLLSYNMPKLKLSENGTTFTAINGDNIKNLKILVPDLPTQKRIADILSTYDDLIENNNRRIVLLEKAAQELYKEWFVRFRFPGYETAKFENGLPTGWEIKKIGDIARIKSGYAFKSEWWSDEGVPVIKIKDIQNTTIDFSDLSRVSEAHALLAKQFFVTEGDLLIAMTGATIGKLALVPFSSERLVVNQRVGKFFLGDNPVSTVSFLYCTLQQNWIQELILMIASSNAAQPNISPFDIEKIKIIYNKEMVDDFNKQASNLIEQIMLLRKRNQNLSKQRDLLLPRLISGKLEV